jgi:cytochrome c-type biogenesis protein CcmH/NrfG
MFSAMETMLTTTGSGVHVALTVALLAACVANLLLVCAWL